MVLLHYLKKYIPEPMLAVYHFVLAKSAMMLYGHPSEELIVIGVTGTKGKSSTTRFIADILTELGEKVGYTSTAGFSIAGQDIVNKMKMTMPGRFYLQSLLRRMVKSGCKYAVVETSSQGIVQYRHLGINYDVAVFTNLTPEHLEAHGGFENYKKAKGRLFAHLSKRRRKEIDGQKIPKISVLNADDKNVRYYAGFTVDRHYFFTWNSNPDVECVPGHDQIVTVAEDKSDRTGMSLLVNELPVKLSLEAKFQRLNAVAAITAVKALGFSLTDVLAAAEKLRGLPGRFELVAAGQPFKVVIDYAYEPAALEALYTAVKHLDPGRIIGIHGSAGGGRDVARRPVIGKIAAEHEDIVIVTNEDPYDEDPLQIMNQVAAGAIAAGKVENENVVIIPDRQSAIDAAMALAQPGDVVLLTGKGSEPVMAVAGGKKLPWSDQQAALKALSKLGYNHA